MTRLAALQRSFQGHVYRPGRAMERRVAEGPRADAARRLGVYTDAYRSRLIEALGSDYPALQKQMGERRFEALVGEFIAARPSVFPNLRWYGADLARFMTRSARWRSPVLLAELAEFEWALGLAFDAADAPLIDAAALARVPTEAWPHQRFRLHPSVHRLTLRSNAPLAWHAAVRKGRRSGSRLRARPADWLVWRKDFEPFYRELAADEAAALDAVARGRSFAFVCTVLRRHADADAARRGAQLLRNWLAEGLICGLGAMTNKEAP